MSARQLRLIGTSAMVNAIGEPGVHLITAEVEVRLPGMAHRPAADAIVEIEQAGLVRDFRAGACRHQSARWRRRDRGLLVTRALAQEATGADRDDARLRRRNRGIRRGFCLRCWRRSRSGSARSRGWRWRGRWRRTRRGDLWLGRRCGCRRGTRCLWRRGFRCGFALLARLDRRWAGFQAKAMRLANHGVAADTAQFFGDLAGGRAAFPHLRQFLDPLFGPAHASNLSFRATEMRPA